jgi:hypothetical protein
MRLGGGGNFGRLSGQQVGKLRDALLDAFSQVPRLDEMLLVFANKNRQAIALGNNLNNIVFLVIQAAEDESWTAELLAAARDAAPRNEALLSFAQQFGLAPETPSGGALQNKIRDGNGTMDVGPWLRRLGEIEGQVCRIEIDTGNPPDYGTGFLVGPDVLMTNYHVLEKVLNGVVPPSKLTLRFDYKMLANGPAVHAGTTYRLAAEPEKWLLHASPYSAHDLAASPLGTPQPDELDYALLRVAASPGLDPVGAPAASLADPQPRRWVELPAALPELKKESTVFIVQHPEGAPLKMALDTQSVIGVNSNGTRVRYATTTEGGSSGSPCFDANWNLIALHHSGDPRYSKLRRAEFNQGIPMAAIVADLRRAGKLGLLGAP